MKQVSYTRLENREERSLAHMAAVAYNDCWYGGAKAMVLAKRLATMGSRLDYDDVISQAYHSHNGIAHDYSAYKCPECGNVCFGRDGAAECCLPSEDDFDLDDFEKEDE